MGTVVWLEVEMSDCIFQGVVDFIEAKINQKLWLYGEKIPSIRTLVKEHQVSKNTVIRALTELEQKGLISAKAKVGFFVSFQEKNNLLPNQLYPDFNPTKVAVPFLFYDIMYRSAAFDILPKSSTEQASKHLLELNRHLGRALKESMHEKSMYYDSPLGSKALRFQISERYRNRALKLNADDLCITSGCQHALFLALLVTCEPGDNVAVESPAFYGVVQLLEQLNLNIIEISASPTTGLDVNELANAIEQWPIKACIVTPSFATPSGALMPDENKQTLVALANEYDFAIIEDDIYGELSFKEPVAPLKCLDRESRVILCSSFSKSLSRDLRIGWIAAGRWQQAVVRLKLTSQLASSQTQQQGLTSFISSGGYRKHLDYFKIKLAHQRNQLIDAILKHWPATIRFTVPEGGIALWLELDKNIDTAELYLEAVKANIVITPGSLFTCSDYYRNFLRLSFNHPTVGKRLQAIKKLGALLKLSSAN